MLDISSAILLVDSDCGSCALHRAMVTRIWTPLSCSQVQGGQFPFPKFVVGGVHEGNRVHQQL